MSNCIQFGIHHVKQFAKTDHGYAVSESIGDEIISTIDCNIKDKRIYVVTYDHGQRKQDQQSVYSIDQDQIIDVGTEGRRWEGSCQQGKPFGFGRFYNEQNNIVYEGFTINGVNMCYGTEFFTETHSVQYRGGFYQGQRFGYGTLYDQHGTLLYEGNWFYGYPTYNPILEIAMGMQDDSIIHAFLQEVRMGDECFTSISSFYLKQYPYLKNITIGSKCFSKVTTVVVEECNALEIFVIGVDSFNDHLEWRMKGYSIFENPTHSFHIRNCELLKKIEFASGCCCGFGGGCELKSRLWNP